jgi:uncharacterized protein with HEPN domain
MNKNSRDFALIARIYQYCLEIEETVNRFGDSFKQFSVDKIYRNAVGMCIIQIGELAGRLSKEFITANPEIPWRSIKAMRNIIAHTYGSADIHDIWGTIKNDIPGLGIYCLELMRRVSGGLSGGRGY